MDQAPDITAVEDVLRQAISWAKTQGLVIRPGGFGDLIWNVSEGWTRLGGRQVCPLSALILHANPAEHLDMADAITAVCGLSEGQQIEFFLGFDALEPSNDPVHDNPSYRLGQQFRREWEQGLFDAASETICDGGDPDGV